VASRFQPPRGRRPDSPAARDSAGGFGHLTW
jgi:hypothetical protein